MKNLLSVLLFAGMLIGCAATNSPRNASRETLPGENPGSDIVAGEATLEATPDTLPQTNTPGTMDMTSSLPDVDKYIDLAKQDLANRLKIDSARITLQRAMEITWPNIAMGCSPGTGQILTKGKVYGYRVWLEAQGKRYIYHVGLTGQVILCPELNPGANNPLLRTPGGTGQDPQNQAP